MQALTFTLLFIFMVIIDAWGDTIKMRTGNWPGWLSEDFLILSGFIIGGMAIHYDLSFIELLKLFFGYMLMRMALFGAVWAMCMPSLRWDYIGRTKWYDRILMWIMHESWFGRKFKPSQKMFLGIFYTACFLFSLVLTGIFKLLES